MILSSTEPDSIYVYKFFNSGEERVQTAWSKWTFTGSILDMFLIDEYLYILKKDARVAGKWLLESVDYTNNSKVKVFTDSYNTNYTSYIELAEVVLQDTTGKVIVNARSPLMYRTIQITSTDESRYKIRIKNKIRERVAENNSLIDNKILVQGKSTDVDILVESDGSNPLEFHTYTIELNHNSRAKII